MPEEKSPPQQMMDMNRSNLETFEALEMLAKIAVAGLKNYGQVTFVMRPDDGVAFANPAHVHIHPQAIEDLGDKPYRIVRPILGDGRPSFVIWKDGILWEIEFIDEQPQAKPGS